MEGSAVIVRPVELRDAAQVRENCFSQNTLEEVRAQIEANLLVHEQGNALQLVAEVDGTVAGIVTVVRNPHPLYHHRAEVVGLVVHPDYQRRGLARRLVEACGAYAASLGVEILEISCRAGTPAEEVYARLGFATLGRLPRGIVEPLGEQQAYDQVYFYRLLR